MLIVLPRQFDAYQQLLDFYVPKTLVFSRTSRSHSYGKQLQNYESESLQSLGKRAQSFDGL